MPVVHFDKQVSWSEFSKLSARPSNKDEDAQIRQEISFSNFQLQHAGGLVSIKDVNVVLSLVASDCWVVSNQMSNSLLKHEQGHFDILALSARDLYQALLKLSEKTVAALQKTAMNLQISFGKQATTVNDRYDTQSDHSRNSTNQQIWDNRILSAKLNPQGTLASLP